MRPAVAYGFGGLRVESSVHIKGLRPAAPHNVWAGQVCLDTCVDAPPPAEAPLFHWPGRYGLALAQAEPGRWWLSSHRGAAFLVQGDGRRVKGYGANDDADWFNDVFVRRVLPRLALLQGGLALHAAAVDDGAGAMVLMGATHAGKSSLAAAAALQGWQLLSDDISMLQVPRQNEEAPSDVPPEASPEGPPEVLPAAAGVCLWPDALEALGVPAESCRAMPGYDGKCWFEPALPADACDARPLRAMVDLARSPGGEAPHLEALSRAEALMLAARQLIRFDPRDGAPQEMRRQVPRLARLLTHVPAYRLHYPAGYARLPEVLRHLQTLPLR